MNFDYSVLRNDEKIVFALRSLYSSYGYSQYKMSNFEEYDFYVRNKDFLVSDKIITFTDTDGKLMAMKPDVTLSIIKNCKDEPGYVSKVYYNENVYRAPDTDGPVKEIMQAGLECIGDIGANEVTEVLKLAAESLAIISPSTILEISNLEIISGILDELELSADGKNGILRCINEKNPHHLESICNEESIPENYANALKRLLALYCKPEEALKELKNIISECALSDNSRVSVGLAQLEEIAKCFENDKLCDMLRFDFSVSSNFNYYNGIVFNGFIEGIPTSVLSGGQYDRLMKKIRRSSKAIGFAVYLDVLERLESTEDFSKVTIMTPAEKKSLNIALPKGRLGEQVYEMFAKSGFECPSILENSRKLIFENEEVHVRYFWAKPSDVTIYVERGAADIGVAGKDIILEYSPDVYELLDLNVGKCRMCVAAPKTFKDNPLRTLKVATKFANIAKTYYSSVDREIDIVHLNGSIEIAPILGLTDVIVDIVETGTTLKENDLQVFETIFPISARLIANKASYKFNSALITKIQQEMAQQVKADRK